MYIQILSTKQMKKTYQMPTIELEELVVESGIALSYGEAGAAGQGGHYGGYYDDETGEMIEL